MQSRPIDEYVIFGTQFRYLLDAGPGWPIKGDNFILINLNEFFEYLEKLQLPVTRRAAWKLPGLAARFEEADQEAVLSEDDAAELNDAMAELRPTLYAETAGLVAYVVSDKRYDVQKLMNDVGALFAAGVYDRLPTIARGDFSEAGMCIAFVRPTAAAFLLLRGTESVLRQYYRGVVRQRRIAEPWMWGPMMDDMRHRRHGPDATLTHNLDGLRQHFRNPTQHPEKVYDIDEAQDLFAACLDAVNRMVGSPRWIDP